MKFRSILGGCLSFCMVGALSGAADAHSVTVDGLATEWSTRTTNADNLGIIARTSTGAGEYIWRDPPGDTRTDIATPELEADVTGVQVTSTAAGLGIFVRLASPASPALQPVQVQIAIDVDRVASSGQQFLAGFADTQVAPESRWEFLIQTQFATLGGGARLLNTAFVPVPAAVVQAARGTDGVELFVTWASLGLSTVPTQPLRFSVATFRETPSGDTVDIGGAASSNALDAVTDYGDPTSGAAPNTFVEVADGILNYSFDVHFNMLGEVYAPLVVRRFVATISASATNSDWIEIRNVSPDILTLPNFKLGDEETPIAGEGMFRFPAGTTLAPGATFIVAENGAGYLARYGTRANAEFVSSDATTPDMLSFPLWSAGTAILSNAGDEILVLDPSNTILDVVTYGSGSYPGVTTLTPIAASGTEAMYSRDVADRDTDNNQTDFTNLGSPCTMDADCGTSGCRQCVLNTCVNRVMGTSCSDSNLCNGAETCSATGTCSAGTALTCTDTNPCTTDTCVPATGCNFPPAAAGTSCADADLCNGSEVCNATSMCVAGTPLVCADTNPCTADACIPATGCVAPPAPDGTPCADSNACNGIEACAAGMCAAGTALTCADTNPCTTDTCDAATGCVFAPAASGTPCADGNLCNGTETCNATAMCTAGTPLTCTDTNPCTAEACEPATGCVFPTAPVGTSCADANMCNGAETCDAAGVCAAATPLSCSDGNPCTNDSCSLATGCVFTIVAAGTPCGDSNVCNGAETCSATGVCGGGTPLVCTDTNPCTLDSCEPATGCAFPPAPLGTPCPDSNVCNGAETCNSAAACVAGTAPTCADTNPCTTDSCDMTLGCQFTAVTAGTSCADSNLCNGSETCSAAGVCGGGTPVTCLPGSVCSPNVCDPATGVCAAAPVISGTPCSDGDICNGLELCNGSGACLPGTVPGDAGCDAGAEDAASDAAPEASVDAGTDAVADIGADITGDVAVDVASDIVVIDGGVTDVVVVDVQPDTTAEDVVDVQAADTGPAVDVIDVAMVVDAGTDSGITSDASVTDVPVTDTAIADAGRRDTGTIVTDATADGSITLGGGGACACRTAIGTAPASSTPRALLASFIALGLVVVRRRRRR